MCLISRYENNASLIKAEVHKQYEIHVCDILEKNLVCVLSDLLISVAFEFSDLLSDLHK